MTLLLTRAQALAVMSSRSGARLDPRLTADGQQAVSEAALTNPAYADVASTLAAAATGTVTEWADTARPTILVGGKPMIMNNARQPYSLSEPATDVFRMEVRGNDPGTPTDLRNGNRRSEIVSDEGGYTAGQTIWAAWSTIFGPRPALALTDAQSPPRYGYICQVHSGHSGYSPVVTIDASLNRWRIATASDANSSSSQSGWGVITDRYVGTDALPAQGTITRFVMAVTLGETGHLKVWMNGSVLYDADIPIGYWTLGGALGYPQWGLYTKNWNTTDVVYHANIEWGTTNLSARVASPLSVPDLSPWN